MGHPDFRANGKIFATLYPDGHNGMVKLTPEQQSDFVSADPAFKPASGAWGRQGCTTVTLEAADSNAVGEAMTLAWQNTVARPGGRVARTSTASSQARRREPRGGRTRARKKR